jgi:hypothetical protein
MSAEREYETPAIDSREVIRVPLIGGKSKPNNT